MTYTRAYLHHLVKIKEPAGKRLMSIHNLHFVLQLVEKAKENIKKGTFTEFKDEFLRKWNSKREN